MASNESADDGLKPTKKTRDPKHVHRGGFPHCPPTSKVVADEDVRRLIEQEDIDYINRFMK